MTDDGIKGETADARKPLVSQIEALWSTICQRLKTQTTDYNSEMGKDLHVEIGKARGWVNVWTFDSEKKETTRVEFDLTMNTGGLSVWFKQGNNRTGRLPVETSVDGDTLVVRYDGESVAPDEMVDRVLKRWLNPPPGKPPLGYS